MTVTRFLSSVFLMAVVIRTQSINKKAFAEAKDKAKADATDAPKESDFYRLSLEDACHIAASIHGEPCLAIIVLTVFRADEAKATDWAERHIEQEMPDELKTILAIISGSIFSR